MQDIRWKPPADALTKNASPKLRKATKKNHSSLFVLIQEAPHTPSVCVYFSFFYHTLPSTCMQPIPLICTQSHNSFHCFLVGLLSTLLALSFNFLLRAPLPTFSAMWDTCAWLLCQATESESHTQLVPRTNFIFFLISCLLWCQHFLIVPSQARSGFAITCVLCPCMSGSHVLIVQWWCTGGCYCEAISTALLLHGSPAVYMWLGIEIGQIGQHLGNCA